jgi:FkbM family methyltransferase
MPSKLLKLALRPFGYSLSKHRPHLDQTLRLVRAAEMRGVALILDVGANRGQFARGLFKAGYRGRVVSFEPLSTAHAELQEAALGNDRWQVFRRCALGATPGRAAINVSGNSQSSSFLPMLDRHVNALPSSRYVGTEETEVVTLDQVLGEDFPGSTPVGVKIDVQGYEHEVLKGLQAERDRVALIYTELSLTPLYDGEAKFTQVIEELAADGFRCVSLTPNFVDPQTYEVLDTNALFVRDSVG